MKFDDIKKLNNLLFKAMADFDIIDDDGEQAETCFLNTESVESKCRLTKQLENKEWRYINNLGSIPAFYDYLGDKNLKGTKKDFDDAYDAMLAWAVTEYIKKNTPEIADDPEAMIDALEDGNDLIVDILTSDFFEDLDFSFVVNVERDKDDLIISTWAKVSYEGRAQFSLRVNEKSTLENIENADEAVEIICDLLEDLNF